jgi:hypothetical protein
VFTARYALSPYIKQIRFVFKGLTGGWVGPRYGLGVYERNKFLAPAGIGTHDRATP